MAAPTRGIIVALENTPQAADDFYDAASTGLTEDSTGIVWLAVMANDLGGNAKTLYSLDDSISEGGDRPTDLIAQDLGRTEATSSDTSLGGATIWIGPDGRVGYDASTLNSAFRAQLQQLNPGQYLTDTFTYAIRLADGAISWATATVQFSGVNDAPTISGAVVGNAVEDGSSVTIDALANASDVDDGATLTVVNVPGALPPGVSYNAADHSFTLNPAIDAYQYLANGQTTTVTVNFGVSDGTVTTAASVNFIVTGTNDAPIVAAVDVTGSATELGTPVDNLTDSGTIAFTDVDLADVHSVGAVTPSAGALGTLTASVTTGTDDSTGLGGEVTWNYSVAAAALEYLAKDETKEESFSFDLSDGQGGTVTRTISVTLTGTNDAPIVAAVDVTGSATELGTPVGNLTDSGTIAFTDVDLADVHSVGAVTPSAGALGTLTAGVTTGTDDSTGLGGVVTWNYSVAAAALEYLAKDETKEETFSFDLSDGQGGTVSRTVSVTLTGTNDAPNIQTVTTDSAAKTLDETDTGLTSTGTLTVTDADTADTVASSVTGVTLGGTTGALTAAAVLSFLSVSPTSDLAADTGDTHNLTWDFNSGSQAFDYLAVGQSLTLAYTVESGDGMGGTDTQQVSITIEGTADGPTDIVLTPSASPGGNNLPNSVIGQLSAIGATGSVSFSATVVEKNLAGGVENLVATDISVSSTGVVTAASGANGVEQGRIYEVNVTATDSGGSLVEMFRVVYGSTNADSITLDSTVEDLAFLIGGNDTVFAGEGNDYVYGQNDADSIHGGGGNDVLWGMNGNDTYYFDTALNAATNVDTIQDFNANAADKIRLNDDIFSAFTVGANTTLAAGNFAANGGGNATDGNDFILYDTASGNLYYDADGNGAGAKILFATLTLAGVTGTVDNTDFVVIP